LPVYVKMDGGSSQHFADRGAIPGMFRWLQDMNRPGDVTICMIARTSYRSYFTHSLSTLHYCNAPSLATQLTGDYCDRTYSGWRGLALLNTLCNKKEAITSHVMRCYSFLYNIILQYLYLFFFILQYIKTYSLISIPLF
jgi:hypothetical protein